MQLFAEPIILLFIAYFISALYLIVYDCPIQQAKETLLVEKPNGF